jgi:putative DNA primase/helicase
MRNQAFKLDADQVRAAAEGRWLDILQRLAPEIDSRAFAKLGRHVTCPVHGTGQKGGHGDGFRLYKDAAQTGGCICNTCGNYPNGFKTLQWLKGWTFTQALQAVADLLGGHMIDNVGALPAHKPASAPRGLSDEFVRELRKKVWRGSLPANDASAEPLRRYLESRGLDPDMLLVNPKSFRFHPNLEYIGNDGKPIATFPGLLMVVSNARGEAVNIHRLYLSSEGGKAPVEEPRLMMPVSRNEMISGCAIRTTPDVPRVLGVAEGLETALSVTKATGIPCWSLYSTRLMEQFEIPEGVEELIIWADKDRKEGGIAAARALKARAWEAGVKARILLPAQEIPEGKKGIDWADVLELYGMTGFPKLNIAENNATTPAPTPAAPHLAEKDETTAMTCVASGVAVSMPQHLFETHAAEKTAAKLDLAADPAFRSVGQVKKKGFFARLFGG